MSTYTPIATQTLTSNTTTVTFASIPQNYTDLVLVYNGTNSDDNAGIVLRLNDDAGSNYSDIQLNGYSSGPNSTITINNPGIDWTFGSGPTVRTLCVSNFMSYSDPNVYKTVLTRSNAAGSGGTAVRLNTTLWANTNPITSISVFRTAGATITSGATFNLYGIVAGGGYALGGDIVTTDGTYWYHTFLSSGAFTPTKALTVDYLVVAGGGSGMKDSNNLGGGGGAGGYRTSIGGTQLSLSSQPYTVIIGAGGPAPTGTPNVVGITGNESVFATIRSSGGGGGGSDRSGQQARSGGSGGGGGATQNGAAGNLGGYSPVEGYAGGNSVGEGGGGGGGSSAVGGNSNIVGSGSGSAGNGGAGTSNSISGSAVTYAGGGGGSTYRSGQTKGSGGAGGGGAGSEGYVAAAAVSGTANTGGGGGAGSGRVDLGIVNAAGAGGSGIVIVRYAV